MRACLVLVVVALATLAAARVNPLASSRALLQTCDRKTFSALTPTVTRAPVIDLQWLDRNDQNVLAITKRIGLDSGGLWMSSDGGKHWTEKTAALNSTVPSTENVDIMAIFSQKSNPANVVLLGTGSYVWSSSDFGASFTPHQTLGKFKGSGIKDYKLHPRQESWLMVLVKRPDCRSMDHAQMECPHDLMLTKNLFSGNPTWTNLTAEAGGKIAGFVDFDWGAALCTHGDCSALQVKDELVLATMYEKAGDYDQPWDPDVSFISSDDWMHSYKKKIKCGNMFEVIGTTIYLAMANSCPTDIDGNTRHERSGFPQGITLYTSTDGGCKFNQACLPVAVKQEGYELLETHDGTGAVIIVDFLINNGIMDIPASSVYTAGPHHAMFSLSLTDIYHAQFGFSADFAKVEGLPGVYIANTMLARTDGSGSADDYYDLSDSTGKPLVESRITFNGGGRWQRIPAPTAFNNAWCNRCDGNAECYLHLHGMSSWDTMATSYPAVYSNPSAPGFIMASGNTGVKGVGLDDNEGLCTWLSTDGGVTWSDVGVGAYIYEFADWGGLVVMARHSGANTKAAEEVLFSWDSGKCWQSVPLSEALLVDNIRIEPDGQRPRVVVHGRRCRRSISQLCGYPDDRQGGSTEGVMYLVDVQELVGTQIGLCAAPDRENWAIPADGKTGARCVLGRQSFIERRRPTSACFNGPDYKRPVPQNTSCACVAEQDTECDYGYLKSGSQCVKIPNDRMPYCPAIDHGYYKVSSTGRRVVHADTCSNPKAVIPDVDKTSANWPSSSGGCSGGNGGGGGSSRGKKRHSALFGFFMFLLVTVILAGGFTGWWIYLATEVQRDMVRDLVAGAAGTAAGFVHWLRERIGCKRAVPADQDLAYFQPLEDANGDLDGDGRSLFTLK